MESKINHVFLSYTDGYPVKFSAANTKFGFLGKGLVSLGDEVHTINKVYGTNNVAPEKGETDGIIYHSFVHRGNKIVATIINTFRVLFLINTLFSKQKQNVLYIGCGNVFVFYPILLFSKIKGYKSAFIFEEWQPGMDFKGLYKLNAEIHGKYFGYSFDCIIPISEFLIEKSKKFGKPLFKLPICADFSNYENEYHYKSYKEQYFLYCAALGYRQALDFVLQSFEKAFADSNEIYLHLVLVGTEKEIDEFKHSISPKISKQVTVYTNLPYNNLLDEYSNSLGLLIPLFENRITDIARFSQKISEYLTSKRPILSTNVGEITQYFKNGDNMYISNSGDISAYSEMMKKVVTYPLEANNIGKNGFEYGKKMFDYRVLSKQLRDFIQSTVK